MIQELKPEQLRWTCKTFECVFDDTSNLEGLPEMIGQDRALRALDFGVGIKSPGFNIFVLGPSGTGRMTAITTILERETAHLPVPDDWCYVYNFDDANRPRAIRLSTGMGCKLQDDLTEMIMDLQSEIPNAFDDESYEHQKAAIIDTLRKQESDRFAALAEEARSESMGLQRHPQGIAVIPLLPDGEPMSAEQFAKLSQEEQKSINERRVRLEKRFAEIAREMVRLSKNIKEQMDELDIQIARNVVAPHMAELRETYQTFNDVVDYLDRMEEDIIHNTQNFFPEQNVEQPVTPNFSAKQPKDSLQRYEVNVLIDNSRTEGAPVILERHATYFNLVGRIEHQAMFGTLTTNFMMIKPGALHHANGGYLVVEARDLLTSPFAYEGLKKTLENAEIRIEEPGEQMRTIATVSIEPEPIPLDVKVVIVGNAQIYHPLMEMDEEFRTLFKVKADFAVDMPRTSASMAQYAAFIAQRCRTENLLHFDQSGVFKVVEYGVWLSGDQSRLTTRFMEIADLVREASFWAGRNRHTLVSGEDVQQALDEKKYRSNLVDERLRDTITDGTIMVDVTGGVVGQINGLAVMGMGDYMFGKPSRITARTFTGQSGIVNIEREVHMSGSLHDKGVLILSGYLGGKYAHKAPLSLSASITFEQSYSGVDGDSASSTELYAILSSLSEVPIKQQYAVTGSVNQRGEIQPIGGVTQKIEGFFEICKAGGLTGDQGVLIPHQNVKNLMLIEEIVEAVGNGLFHVFAVHTIDEGIEILTGMPAGVRGVDGVYPEDTIHGRVERRLQDIRDHLKRAKAATEEK